MRRINQDLVIYQTKDGAIEFRGDATHKTVWGSQKQIAQLFGVERSVVTKHIKNIFSDKEINEKSNVQKMHIAGSDKPVKFYSLDIILAVGYRTSSSTAIQFRIWATKVLKQHLIQGYTINKRRIGWNYRQFLSAITNVKALLPQNISVDSDGLLDLITAFAQTWVSLDAYDNNSLPKTGVGKKVVLITAEDLREVLDKFKKELIKKNQATDIFAQERERGSIEKIVASVFQSAFGQDAYPTIEEKAVHLLYFMVKDHPFVDGNKRSGAFSFVWFLRKVGLLRASLTPEALTTLTLLVAESSPKDKERVVGLVLLLLKGTKHA